MTVIEICYQSRLLKLHFPLATIFTAIKEQSAGGGEGQAWTLYQAGVGQDAVW